MSKEDKPQITQVNEQKFMHTLDIAISNLPREDEPGHELTKKLIDLKQSAIDSLDSGYITHFYISSDGRMYFTSAPKGDLGFKLPKEDK